MTVGAVVQARMTSARLPGKVLRPLAGRPLLAWLDERLSHASSLDGRVLATSIEPSDDPVAAWSAGAGVRCHRGPLDDVAGRMAAAAEAAGFDVVVRVSGDSPLLDPAVVDRVVAAYGEGGADVVTNVRPRTFPAGQSVEVVATALLAEAATEMTAPAHREHVMPWFYESPDRYRIRNLRCRRDLAAVRMSVDTEMDARILDSVLKTIARGTRPHWTFRCDELADLVIQTAR